MKDFLSKWKIWFCSVSSWTRLYNTVLICAYLSSTYYYLLLKIITIFIYHTAKLLWLAHKKLRDFIATYFYMCRSHVHVLPMCALNASMYLSCQHHTKCCVCNNQCEHYKVVQQHYSVCLSHMVFAVHWDFIFWNINIYYCILFYILLFNLAIASYMGRSSYLYEAKIIISFPLSRSRDV